MDKVKVLAKVTDPEALKLGFTLSALNHPLLYSQALFVSWPSPFAYDSRDQCVPNTHNPALSSVLF